MNEVRRAELQVSSFYTRSEWNCVKWSPMVLWTQHNIHRMFLLWGWNVQSYGAVPSSFVRFGLISECLLSRWGCWFHPPWVTVLSSTISAHPQCSTSNCCVNREAKASGSKGSATYYWIWGCAGRFPFASFIFPLKKCYIAFWFVFISFCFSSLDWFTLFGSALRTSHIVWPAPGCIPHHLAGATQAAQRETPCCSSPLPLLTSLCQGSWRIRCQQWFWIYGLLWLVIEDELFVIWQLLPSLKTRLLSFSERLKNPKTLESKCRKKKDWLTF